MTKLPPLLRKDGERERKKRSSNNKLPKAHEKLVAESVGGKRVRGSGAFEDKGDVNRECGDFQFKIECKRTVNESIGLKAQWLTKISEEARAAGVYPALSIQFDKQVMRKIAGARGSMAASEDWVAIPLRVFQELLDAAESE